MPLPKLEGLISISSAIVFSTTDSDGTSNKTFPAGDYYLTTNGGAGSSLLAQLKTTLEGGAGTVTYTITLDDNSDTSTGKVTIVPSAGTLSTTWSTGDPATLMSILGFAADISASASATGANQARYLWLAPVNRSDPHSPDPSSASQHIGSRETDATVAIAPGGQTVTLVYSTRYLDNLEFRSVLGSRMWIEHESTVNESLEKFYSDVIGAGKRFRYHPGRDSDTVYFTWVCTDPRRFHPRPVFANWVGEKSTWSIAYPVIEYTA